MEAAQHADNQFVTLTYSDSSLPMVSSLKSRSNLATLNPRDLQLFLKRLRFHSPQKLRFFAVGEYGPQTFRPHYHAGIFNFPRCERGGTLQSHTGRRLWADCCPTCNMVGKIWDQGDIEVRNLDTSKCEYLARYVTKKMTKVEDGRLDGRFPEFSRQSRRPGIGALSVVAMADLIEKHVPKSEFVDVPSHLMQGKSSLLLGRYLRRKLRAELGLPEETPARVLQSAWVEQMLPVLLAAFKDREAFTLKAQLQKLNQPYADRLKWRAANYEKGGKL